MPRETVERLRQQQLDKSDWKPEHVEMLRRLWEQNHGARCIASMLNRDGSQFSHNAVIGKAHRLGLKPRPSPIKRRA